MRALADYGLAEWAMAAPLTHGFKRVRNIAVERTFRSMRARGHDRFMSDLADLQPQTLAVVIAFNTSWVIDVMTRLAQRNLVGTLVVCDNSRDRAARREIERICRDRGIAYLPLPVNPDRHPCRSHGIALNWAYYNIVAPLQPRVFGCLDHDLFVVEHLDPAALVADQPVYGGVTSSRWGWNLWAGFAIFDRAAVAPFMPDFNNDRPRGLDTGGRNWTQIYRHLDRSGLRFATRNRQELYLPDDGRTLNVQMVDRCVHAVGIGSADRARATHTEAFMRCVVRHIEAGGTMADLTRASGYEQVA